MDAVIISVYVVLALVSIFLILQTLKKRNRSRMDSHLIFVSAVILGWLLSMIAFFLSRDIPLARFLFDIKLPFVALTALAWFLYIVHFYGLESYFPRAVTLSLFIVPLFTLILALTSPHHNFIRQELEILQTVPRHTFRMIRGPWFWYHSAYCYSLMLTAFVIVMTQHRKIRKEYRLPSTLLFLGLALSVSANIFVVSVSLVVDLSLIMASLSLILLYLATKNYRELDFCIRARQEAFHYLDRAIFILDDEDGLVRSNRSAVFWLEKTGIVLNSRSFQSITDQMAELSEKQESLEDPENMRDYYFGSGKVFNLRKKPICDRKENRLGAFVFITDETENRKLINHLDRHSGMDALTGLSNRRKLEEITAQMDAEESYPLSVITGDLNNLKETNDTLGHQQGDILLRVAAETLRDICPPMARIFRTGGDEFVILLPRHTEEQTSRLADDIRAAMKKQNGRHPFLLSMALGYAIKTSPAVDFQETLRMADAAMYSDKQRYKISNAAKASRAKKE